MYSEVLFSRQISEASQSDLLDGNHARGSARHGQRFWLHAGRRGEQAFGDSDGRSPSADLRRPSPPQLYDSSHACLVSRAARYREVGSALSYAGMSARTHAQMPEMADEGTVDAGGQQLLSR